MGTTAQKLNKILETKDAIRTAINNKGGTLTTTDTFASYPSAIDSLPSGGGNTLKTLLDATKSTSYLFYQYSGTNIDGLISYNDTSSVKNMSNMFYSCWNLTTIPQLDTRSATNMSSMFNGCTKLVTIDITYMANNSSSFASYCYHFDGTTDPTYNPQGLKDGRIYVPDDKVDALKEKYGWKTYADIIVPLSTLVE